MMLISVNLWKNKLIDMPPLDDLLARPGDRDENSRHLHDASSNRKTAEFLAQQSRNMKWDLSDPVITDADIRTLLSKSKHNEQSAMDMLGVCVGQLRQIAGAENVLDGDDHGVRFLLLEEMVRQGSRYACTSGIFLVLARMVNNATDLAPIVGVLEYYRGNKPDYLSDTDFDMLLARSMVMAMFTRLPKMNIRVIPGNITLNKLAQAKIDFERYVNYYNTDELTKRYILDAMRFPGFEHHALMVWHEDYFGCTRHVSEVLLLFAVSRDDALKKQVFEQLVLMYVMYKSADEDFCASGYLNNFANIFWSCQKETRVVPGVGLNVIKDANFFQQKVFEYLVQCEPAVYIRIMSRIIRGVAIDECDIDLISKSSLVGGLTPSQDVILKGVLAFMHESECANEPVNKRLREISMTADTSWDTALALYQMVASTRSRHHMYTYVCQGSHEAYTKLVLKMLVMPIASPIQRFHNHYPYLSRAVTLCGGISTLVWALNHLALALIVSCVLFSMRLCTAFLIALTAPIDSLHKKLSQPQGGV